MEKDNQEEKKQESSIEINENSVANESVEIASDIIESDITKKNTRIGIITKISEKIKNLKPSTLGFVTGILILLIANAILFTFNANFSRSNNKFDNISIAGINLNGMSPDFAKNQLISMSNNQLMTIDVGGKKVEATAQDFGVKRYVENSIDDAIKYKRSFLEKIKLKDKQQIDIPLKTTIDKEKLNNYLASQLGNDIIAKNATLSEQNGNFIVNPGSDGVDVDTNYLAEQITNIALSTNNIIITAQTNPIKPTIQTAAAEEAKVAAEQLISGNYLVGNDSVGFRSVQNTQKAKWVNIEPNDSSGNISVNINKDKALSDIESTIRSFNKQAKDRVTVSIPSSGEVVLEVGSDGISVPETEIAKARILAKDALDNNKAVTITITTLPIPKSLKNMDGEEKMVLVDIDRFTTYAIENGQVQKSVIVSTGKRGHETPRGKYTVLFKIRESAMRGCSFDGCWDVPNVKWQTYFTNQGHAIHGAYWYINWGRQNVSHGCVNMLESDAKWFYDWTEKGTPVIVV